MRGFAADRSSYVSRKPLHRADAVVREEDVGVAARAAAARRGPPADFRSSATERLPRLCASKYGLRPRSFCIWKKRPGVARRALLDLDHVGAEVGHERGRVRALLPDRQVEDADAFEGLAHAPILAPARRSVQNSLRVDRRSAIAYNGAMTDLDASADLRAPGLARPARSHRRAPASRSKRRGPLPARSSCRRSIARHERVVVAGMGGSGIGGLLLQALAAATGADVPVSIVRGYGMPGYVDARTLVLASSNSGDTEETVAAFGAALDAGAMCVAIATGGRLAALARERGVPLLAFEWAGEPRSALGWSTASLMAICDGLGLVPGVEAQLRPALEHMRGDRARHRPRRAGARKPRETARASAGRASCPSTSAPKRSRRSRTDGGRRRTRMRSRGPSPTSCRR